MYILIYKVNNVTKILHDANKSIPGLYPVKIDQGLAKFLKS